MSLLWRQNICEDFKILLILRLCCSHQEPPCGCELQHTVLLEVNGCMEHFVVECLLSITLGFKRAICEIWPEFSLRCQWKLAC